MTKKQAIESMLFGCDQYTSMTMIRLFGGFSRKVAVEVFERCRKIDLEKIDIDIRPNHVLQSTFFNVVGIDYELEVLRYHKFNN